MTGLPGRTAQQQMPGELAQGALVICNEGITRAFSGRGRPHLSQLCAMSQLQLGCGCNDTKEARCKVEKLGLDWWWIHRWGPEGTGVMLIPYTQNTLGGEKGDGWAEVVGPAAKVTVEVAEPLVDNQEGLQADDGREGVEGVETLVPKDDLGMDDTKPDKLLRCECGKGQGGHAVAMRTKTALQSHTGMLNQCQCLLFLASSGERGGRNRRKNKVGIDHQVMRPSAEVTVSYPSMCKEEPSNGMVPCYLWTQHENRYGSGNQIQWGCAILTRADDVGSLLLT